MEIHIAGRAPDKVTVDKTRRLLTENFEFGRSKIDGEVNKSPEQLDLISIVNEVYEREFDDLGIPEHFTSLHPDSVHFLPADVYASLIPNSKGPAFCVEDLDAIIINQASVDIDRRSAVFTLLHESSHRWSYKEFVLNQETQMPKVKIGGFRVAWPNEFGYLFSAIDEAMADLTAQTIQHRNFELFFGEGSTFESIVPQIGAYYKEMKLMQNIIEKVSEAKNEDVVNTWIRFSRAFYAGERSVLKDVDLVMGAGHVKYLATLEPDRSDYSFEDYL